VLLNEQGGIVDDLIVYSEGIDRATVIINAATTAKDLAWLAAHLDPAVTVIDQSAEQILIAVQGPAAAATLQPWITADLGQLKFYRSIRTHLGTDPVFMARTGYTGEDGFEIMLDLEAGQRLWQRLIEAGVAPCGLGSRDTLRLEAAMALYGQDITEETTPFEGSLDWLVHFDRKGDFIGRAALEAQQAAGIPRRLVGLSLPDRHIARHDYPVLYQGEPVGIVTSGTFSPTLSRPIALAYVPTALAEVGQALEVQIRNKFITAEVVNRPFYRRPKP
jgi:aminomethyltransferase